MPTVHRVAGLAIIALLSACSFMRPQHQQTGAGPASPAASTPARETDAAGRMAFNGNDFRHPGGSPFWCFNYVDPAGGGEMALCHEIEEWCARGLREAHDNEAVVLSACRSVDTVWCFSRGSEATFIASTDTQCFGEPSMCDMYSDRLVQQGASPAAVSSCVQLDTSFEPT